MTPRHVAVGDITIGNDLPLVFIVGPNTLESRAHALETSAALDSFGHPLQVNLPWWAWNLLGEQAVFLLRRKAR